LGLTANVNAIDRERFIQAGAEGFLLKPFDRKVLMETAERLLLSSKKPMASSVPSSPSHRQ
jgi:CheY-like chemotaxis protein